MIPVQNLSVSIQRDGGRWEAIARLELVGAHSPIVLHASVDVAAIRNALILRHLPAEGAVSGGFFSFIKNAAKKIARAKIWAKVGSAIKSAVNSPALAAAVGVGSMFCPAIGAVYVAAKAAVMVADKVSKGDASVIANVTQIAESAAAKNPLAAQAVDALKAVQSSPFAQFIPAIA